MATYWPSSSFCVFMDRDGVVVRKVGKLVRQSQIVQSVMQDCQYVLSHLLHVCNLLVQGTKITYDYCLSRRF